jgi:alanine racemase
MVDVGPDSEVELYDEVILFGPHPPAPDAEEIAGLMQTIPYEVTCLISRRVPRVFGQ